MIDIDTIARICASAPSGKWEVHTSNSWRRVFANQGREKVRVIEPTNHPVDKWPDLMFGPGVQEYLENITPHVVAVLVAEVRRLREEKDALFCACRVAVLALAHASQSDPMYQKTYDHVSAAIDAARIEE